MTKPNALGAFHAAMGKVSAAHNARPGQDALLCSLLDFLNASPSSQRNARNDNERRPLIYTAEVGTGVGKTLAYLAASAMVSIQAGRRVIISTQTRALRDEIERQGKPLVTALAGSSPVPIIGAVRTLSSACSIEMPEFLLTQESKAPTGLGPVIRDYIAWTKAAYADGRMPTPQEWVAESGDWRFAGSEKDDALRRLAITNKEMRRTKGDVRHVLEKGARSNAKAIDDADILIVTHALLVRNGVEFGQTLGTSTRDTKLRPATSKRFDLIIDEADSLIGQDAGSVEAAVSVEELSDHCDAKVVRRLEALLATALGSVSRRTVATDIGIMTIAKHLREHVIPAVIRRIGIGDDIAKWRSERLAQKLETVVALHEQAGNAVGSIASEADVRLWIEQQKNSGSIAFGVEATRGAHLTSRSWVNNNLQAFDHIALLSGTLLDLPDGGAQSIKTFQDAIGVRRKVDIVHQGASSKPNLHVPIDAMPLAQIDVGTGPGRPWNREASTNDPDYWTAVAKWLASEKDSEQASQMLVLMQSHGAIDLLSCLLDKMSIEHHVQTGGGVAAACAIMVGAQNARTSSIVMTTSWQGSNYVEDGQTLVDHVVIPQLPIAPPLKTRRTPLKLETVAWKMRNGIGRMYRHPGDTGRLSVLDPRFILPKALRSGQDADEVQRRKYEPLVRAVLGMADSQAQLVGKKTIIQTTFATSAIKSSS